jgi:predicted amidohydrolase YtcJ
MEDVKGRIVPGQLADIAVFSRNLLSATPEDILDNTQCDLTIRGGSIVYDRLSAT